MPAGNLLPIRRLTLYKHGVGVVERAGGFAGEEAVITLRAAEVNDALKSLVTKLTPDERRILERPEEYRGLAAEVARDVSREWRERLEGVLPE